MQKKKKKGTRTKNRSKTLIRFPVEYYPYTFADLGKVHVSFIWGFHIYLLLGRWAIIYRNMKCQQAS